MIHPADLINLDVTIAEFVAPHLRAFRGAADAYPHDLPDLDAWHAELDAMIAAFENIIVMADEAGRYDPDAQAGVELFARRLGDLWQ